MMRHLIICIVLCVFCGCQSNHDPTTADGALRAFGELLNKGDMSSTYELLSKKSHVHLKTLLTLTKKLNQQIKKYPKDHQNWARKGSLGLLTESADEQSLFFQLIQDKWKWVQKQKDEEVQQALNTRSVLSEDQEKGVATLMTRSNEKFHLRREGEQWRITSFEEPLAQYISVLEANEKTLVSNLKEIRDRTRLKLPLP